MQGTSLAGGTVRTEDGSWEAQIEGGGGDDLEHRHQRRSRLEQRGGRQRAVLEGPGQWVVLLGSHSHLLEYKNFQILPQRNVHYEHTYLWCTTLGAGASHTPKLLLGP